MPLSLQDNHEQLQETIASELNRINVFAHRLYSILYKIEDPFDSADTLRELNRQINWISHLASNLKNEVEKYD